MTITKKSCKNFSEIQKQNRNDIGGSLAGFSSHNYSPAGNTPSHQLNTTLSVAKNTNRPETQIIQIQIQIQQMQIQNTKYNSLPSA